MNERPTGRVRTRLGRERKGFALHPVLVLQVEVRRDDGPSDSNGMPEYLAATYWRDAKPEDLSSITLNSTT